MVRTFPSFLARRAWHFGNTHRNGMSGTSLQASRRGWACLRQLKAAGGNSQRCQTSLPGLWALGTGWVLSSTSEMQECGLRMITVQFQGSVGSEVHAELLSGYLTGARTSPHPTLFLPLCPLLGLSTSHWIQTTRLPASFVDSARGGLKSPCQAYVCGRETSAIFWEVVFLPFHTAALCQSVLEVNYAQLYFRIVFLADSSHSLS